MLLLCDIVLKRLSHTQVADHCIVCDLASILCGHAIGYDLLKQRRIVLLFGREFVGINVLKDFLVGAVDKLTLFCDLCLITIGECLKACERLLIVCLRSAICFRQFELDRRIVSVARRLYGLKHWIALSIIACQKIKGFVLLDRDQSILQRSYFKAICLKIVLNLCVLLV